jgi:NADH-quinone oxidoreductase subunit A
MHFQFANVLIFFALGLGLCGLMLGLGQLLRPSNPNVGKLSTYECGSRPAAGLDQLQHPLLPDRPGVRDLDVELAFIYPVVAVFRDRAEHGQGLFALVEIAVFVGILAVGLVYVWVKGDLEWLKRIPADRPAEAPRRAA